MKTRKLFTLSLGFALGAALPGTLSCRAPAEVDCSNGFDGEEPAGDEGCRAKHGWEVGYCTDGTCSGELEVLSDGCTETAPPLDCWLCEGREGGECEEVAETSGETTEGTEETTDGMETTEGMETSGTETTGGECEESADCGGATPLCEAGSCVGCGEGESVSCSSEYPETPACEEGSGECVVCTEEDVSACTAEAPVCDGGVCVACTEHSQCASGACELDSGECFEGEAVHVDGDNGGCSDSSWGTEEVPFCTIGAAVEDVGEYGGIVLHEMTGASYEESADIVGGEGIAFVGAVGEEPVWENEGVLPSLQARFGAKVFVDGVKFLDSSSSAISISNAGSSVYATHIWAAKSDGVPISVVDNGYLYVRDSFVSAGEGTLDAVSVTAGTFDIAYSTIGAGLGGSASGVYCQNGGDGSSVKKTFIVNLGAAPEMDCEGASMEEVFLEADASEPFGEDSNWFTDFTNGDLHLTANAPAELATFATWAEGDPKTDIDGEPRNAVEGEAGYVGADVPN
ncbi:hypothetical protein G6O69_21650 [Pseudenhygromyxa sp. WMMC2535]|uniref:hypothetical protein n=1 Tax=Pseudenhygromyxa sp. WMMC2535 TaxID=2712867 RepID=UPI001551B6A0|nr:hypothetical protein [Pseudenhygromyxa sp. WMMC2535]NVB40460.1 hypothetical protein [Pseudenhygromyxa sp. WMMC2535]